MHDPFATAAAGTQQLSFLDQVFADDLYQAVLDKDLDAVEELLMEYPHLVHAQTSHGFMACVAAAGSQPEIFRQMLAFGADPAARDRHGVNALMAAATAAQSENVKTLLATTKSINLDARDDGGMTALMQAAFLGSKEIVQMLLDHGATVHIPDFDGENAERIAELWGHHEVAALLKQWPAEKARREQERQQAAAAAAEKACAEVSAETRLETLQRKAPSKFVLKRRV